MEMLDIINMQDEVVDQAPLPEVYQQAALHRIIHVLLFNEKGEMALQLRSRHKSFCPGHWSTAIGGHVQAGESYEAAAFRECQEELGILPPTLTFLTKQFYKDTYTGKNLHNFMTVFTCQYDQELRCNQEEVERVDYFSLKDIQKMIRKKEPFHPQLLFILQRYYNLT